MRILIFTDWFYPAFKAGGPVQSVVNMVDLLKAQHEVFVYTSDRDLYDASPFSGVEADRWLQQNGYTIQYHSPGKMTYKKVKAIITKVQPDKIYLNSMFSNMILPIMAAYTSGKLIIAPRGMLRSTALSVKPIRKYLYLTFLKMLGAEKHVAFHATSEEEQNDIRRIFPLAKEIRIAANLPVKVQNQLLHMTKCSGILNMIFIGRIHPIKNLLYLLEALHKLFSMEQIHAVTKLNSVTKYSSVDSAQNHSSEKLSRPQMQLQLTIAGTIDDRSYWQACQQKIAALENRIKVHLQLDCPHGKITALLQAAHLFVLPTEGENFGHAIFEALAVGCPVLVSDQTPWRNLLSAKAGVDLPLSDQAAFSKSIKTFAEMDNDTWQQYRRGAWKLAADYEKNLDAERNYRELFA